MYATSPLRKCTAGQNHSKYGGKNDERAAKKKAHQQLANQNRRVHGIGRGRAIFGIGTTIRRLADSRKKTRLGLLAERTYMVSRVATGSTSEILLGSVRVVSSPGSEVAPRLEALPDQLFQAPERRLVRL